MAGSRHVSRERNMGPVPGRERGRWMIVAGIICFDNELEGGLVTASPKCAHTISEDRHTRGVVCATKNMLIVSTNHTQNNPSTAFVSGL
mmetsp:Transcript_30019/g.51976  ORF Transcript_30019/g.51976 Transcript_30019/m.51976 type:complete len:89 (-) Transcript_30019:947-1213(-)